MDHLALCKSRRDVTQQITWHSVEKAAGATANTSAGSHRFSGTPWVLLSVRRRPEATFPAWRPSSTDYLALNRGRGVRGRDGPLGRPRDSERSEGTRPLLVSVESCAATIALTLSVKTPWRCGGRWERRRGESGKQEHRSGSLPHSPGRLPGTLSNKGSTTPTIDYLVPYLDDLGGRGHLRRRSKWITWHSVSRGGTSPSRLPGTLWSRAPPTE
jgi:hypothetical protein